jgi:ion channel-forming bestrophin family protein
MYTKRNYGFWLTFWWSKTPFIYGTVYTMLIVALHYLLKSFYNINIALPWQPISTLGIAVAFYLGFKNNASYDRTWEARKIWGGIVNSSRTFGVALLTFIKGEGQDIIHKRLIYRHIAWMTALRFQLRLAREWEHTQDRIKGIYFPEVSDKYYDNLEGELARYLPPEEVALCLKKANVATQILKIQAEDIQKLHERGYVGDLHHIELHRLIGTFFDDQGRSERIKNFPFPRQYASAALWQAVIFAMLIPFGMINIFSESGDCIRFMMIPLSGLMIWAFFLMEKIGDYSENPFEGSYNDIPITTISRSIEIDLRQMIDDQDIPAPIKNEHGFSM